MENSSLTISKQPPELKSMQYDTLRELAIQHIQELAGQLWTDYNTHDPGITILEVLSYALTDLGYRTSFDIKDLLAKEFHSDPDPRNFYTAAQILPNRPLTLEDYRKLLIDVEVVDEEDEECKYAGIKNAWLEKSDEAEQEIFVNRKDSLLSLDPVPGKTEQESYYVKTLYDVLLEFDECDRFGDLNENTIEEDFTLYEHDLEEELEGILFNFKIQFPAWDAQDIDWANPVSVRSHIQSIQVSIDNLPGNYTLTPEITNLNEVILKGNKTEGATTSPIAGITDIIDQLNDFLYGDEDGLLALYIAKVNKIFEIVEAAKARLHANRNLCEDFFRFRAVRVEEIIVCADIEIEASADVEQVEAHIFHLIELFLSPTVYFYTLEEMRNKCHADTQYSIVDINSAKKIITIEAADEAPPVKDDTITVFGLGTSPIELTVHCVDENPDEVNQFDLEVMEELPEEELQEEAYLIKGRFDEDECFTIDHIFEGPLLEHGFIDDEELAAADRKKVIRVSDLIQIIMDVEGVIAVKDIQIANVPQNNEFGIKSKSVRWCLELAFDHNYVPRLDVEGSKMTYYKEQLPFLANDAEVDTLMKELRDAEREQKIRYPKMDMPVPTGRYRNPADYTSIREDFPLAYGVGSEGIPGMDELTLDEQEQRKIQVAQLKGYLLLFDQYLANYLSQVANVKYLFTMEDEVGTTLIDKTYYTQSLVGVLPDDDYLYRDTTDHSETLQLMTEDTRLFEKRRNKFLDHMLGRFAESFADYAMLATRISGSKAPRELIDDKLKFLGQYPVLSSGRGMAIDYRDTCKIWHVDNVAGLDKRGELLLGMAPKEPEDLVFREQLVIDNPSPGVFQVSITDGTSNTLMVVDQDFATEGEARARMEHIIVVGVFRHNFEIRPTDGGGSHFVLTCNDEVLAISERQDYDETSGDPTDDPNPVIDQLVELFTDELYENPEANRKNLACPLTNYIDYEITVDMLPLPEEPPTFTISYTLYEKAFEFTAEQELLTGSVTRETETDDPEEEVQQKAEEALHDVLWDLVNHAAHRRTYYFDPDEAPFTSPYLFKIHNNRGEDIAQSVESDFNTALADAMNALIPAKLLVSGSSGNDGEYDIINATAVDLGPNVEVEVDPAPPTAIFDGHLMFGDSYDVSFIEKSTRNIILTEIDPEIYEGDAIHLTGTESNDGFYTVQSIRHSTDKIYLKVNELFTQDETVGALRKAYEITDVDIGGSAFYIKGGKDEQAITDTINFVTEKFFSCEGFHVVEHILLRPRTDEMLFVDIEEPVLDEGATPLGDLFFWKTVPIQEADAEANTFTVAGDIQAEIEGDQIIVGGGSFNDGEFLKKSVSLQDGNTVIEVETAEGEDVILFDLPDDPFGAGMLSFRKKVTIDSVTAADHTITVSDLDAAALESDFHIEIQGSQDAAHDGNYLVATAEESEDEESDEVIITIYKVEQLVQDRLLPIHLDQEECESCKITDPYSHIATVVVPYWPGRFIDMDFRKFAEKRLRMEAPAHVFLNVCWINCEHMAEFEEKYKQWLIATNTREASPDSVSEALDELIDILTRMRNVYPTGTLHNCEDDDSLEGAIILNNTILGTF
ncbi:hypothetical protein NC796_05635 [Aliifodinibius sp. S!AR15-10]|uniref:hypothetical protein n=1 Tax=Aliifodinibius sp. S!AR15-10 TaxID=2950437 RepID=UPI00285D5680|nr:hypothetical protein [Aliifodinibius sp. S!AR15-10]MDR8390610.1 hypothetical protein [Aliifodinibius sp. S!AR15-10]